MVRLALRSEVLLSCDRVSSDQATGYDGWNLTVTRPNPFPDRIIFLFCFCIIGYRNTNRFPGFRSEPSVCLLYSAASTPQSTNNCS